MAPPAPSTIPDELLEEMFLLLPTPDALARASAACTSFRRVIKGRAFRRRFRALHRPPLLGFMDGAGLHPAPLAGALAPCAADFSFLHSVVSSSSYFVPPGVQDDGEGPRWRPRDGRVLLDWISLHPRSVGTFREYGVDVSILHDSSDSCGFHRRDAATRLMWAKRERCNAADFHLAVCDPLSRRYVLLPTIPEDIAAQPQDRLCEFEPVLAPNTNDDGEEEPFKVICIARYKTKLVLFIFPATIGQWCVVESPVLPSVGLGRMFCFDCVRGCFYWTKYVGRSDHLMVLDTHTMTFSTVNLLTGCHEELRDLPDASFGPRRSNAVVAGREGVLEMFSLVCQHGCFALYHSSLQNNSQEWKLEKTIQLPGQYHYYSICIVGAAEGFLFFQGAPEDTRIQDVNVDCYSMDVKTYEITKVCTKVDNLFNCRHALPYFSFPRVLSEPTI